MKQGIHLVSVFAAGPGGGNPTPVVIDAQGMPDAEMQAVARDYGMESCFVLPAPEGSSCDFEFRFWVPNHEMPMCGHARPGQCGFLTGPALSPLTGWRSGPGADGSRPG